MFLGGAGHAQRFTSPSGVVLRVDRPLWFGIFEHLKDEDMPKKLLNFRIKESGGKKRNSIPIVVASELRKAQYGHPSFPALACGDGLYYECGEDATAFGQATRTGERPVCHVQHPRVRYAISESSSWGVDSKVGGKLHAKLNMCLRPIANKYSEGKMQRTLKRYFKVPDIFGREVNWTSFAW